MTGPAEPAPGPPGARVEVATWRPVEVLDVDGWALGLGGGFTRRANSVVPWRAPADPAAALDEVERVYGRHGLPAVVRVDSTAQPAGLDALLSARGYARVATTHVMARRAAAVGQGTGPGRVCGPDVLVTVAEEPDEDWLTGWLGVKAAGRPVDRGLARAVVTGSPALYLTAWDHGGVAGVVRAAVSGDWVGLSCLMVAPRARRRGLGAVLSTRALDAAAGRATLAFLQVEADNAAAVALYRRLGFVAVDTYHYRERATAR